MRDNVTLSATEPGTIQPWIYIKGFHLGCKIPVFHSSKMLLLATSTSQLHRLGLKQLPYGEQTIDVLIEICLTLLLHETSSLFHLNSLCDSFLC